MSHYIHHVPGRLRVRCPSLRANSPRIRTVCEVLKSRDGVHGIECKKHAGSITIHYYSEVTNADDLIALLKKHGCMTGAKAAPRARIGTVNKHGALSSQALGETVTRTVVGAVVGTLVRHTIEPPVVALLKGAGVAK